MKASTKKPNLEVIDLCDDEDEEFQNSSNSSFLKSQSDDEEFQNFSNFSSLKSQSDQSERSKTTDYKSKTQTSDDDFTRDEPHAELSQNSFNIKISAKTNPKKVERELERARKDMQKKLEKQNRGLYKRSEISLILDKKVETETLSQDVKTLFDEMEGNSKFSLLFHESVVEGSCRWTHRPQLQGGRGNINEPNVVVFPYLIVVMEAERFLQLLFPNNSQIDNPNEPEESSIECQDHFIDDIRQHFSDMNCPLESTLIIVVTNLCAGIVKIQRKNRRVSREAVEEAMIHLLYCKGVNVMTFQDTEGAAEYLRDVTRQLSEMPYRKQEGRLALVDFTKKIKQPPKEEKMTDSEFEEVTLAETWVNMLQMIPRITGPRARNIVQQYPSPHMLLSVLQDQNVPESTRQLLLTDKIDGGEKKKKNPSLSRIIYKIMNSFDPDDEL